MAALVPINNVYFVTTATSGTVVSVQNEDVHERFHAGTANGYRIEPVILFVGDPSIHTSVFVPMNTLVVEGSFFCYPATLQPQMAADYRELGQTLVGLRDASADEWQIDEPVYEIANRVASELMSRSYPVPKVITHGSKSVVFNWQASDDRSLYLTISKDYVSALLSSPAKIERRIEVPVAVLVGKSLIPPFVEWAKSGRAVVTASRSVEISAL